MPWIFMCLMALNAVYFGWEFMQGSTPQASVREKTLPQEGARVQLLSESSLPRTPAAPPASEAATEPEAPVAEAPAKQCFSVGPFGSDADARTFVGNMRGKRFLARIEKRKVDVKDYWVFIPAFTNREKAEERLRELRARGIQAFVVKEGMFLNAISLNHFSQRELAVAYLEKMRDAGVQVEFREMTNVSSEPWVYVSPGQSKEDLRGTIDGLLTSGGTLKREITACED